MGHDVAMIGPSLLYKTKEDNLVFKYWIPIVSWEDSFQDTSLLLDFYKQINGKFIVLDDYRIDSEYLNILRSYGIKTLQFQANFNASLNVNLILNTSPAATKEKYHFSKLTNARFLLGAKYAILRDELLNKNIKYSEDNKVLVCFGGGSDRGAIKLTLNSVCKHFPNYRFTIISGKHNPNNELLKEIIANSHSNVNLMINPSNVPELYSESSFMITAGGGTTFEAAFYKIPMLIIATDERQVNQSKAWSDLGAGYYLGPVDRVSSEQFIGSFLSLITEHSYFEQKFTGSIDGLGKVRIAQEIIQLIH
tara:strand:+ start:3603 stop:4523 length:921 start_codon:yes stop_codon:yes gene_type:complete